eukprot:SAG11_NODE_722_length_7532_cov_6.943630_6_plen_205_part_00
MLVEIGARACFTNDRHNMKTDLCLRRELETTALQLLLNTTDTKQLGRRVNRLVEELDAFVTVEGDDQLLSPRRREALAGLRHFFSDIPVFSDDEDVDSEEGGGDEDIGEAERHVTNVDDADHMEDMPLSDDDDAQDEYGGSRANDVLHTGAITADNFGHPPPYMTEHCPPLPAHGYGPDPQSGCSCGGDRALFCLIECGMRVWL